MPDAIQALHEHQVLVCAPDGPTVQDDGDAIELAGEASFGGAAWVALPVERIGEGFFDLRTGVAGAIVQKFATYRVGLAIVGDVARQLDRSEALRDLVREANRGRQIWFVADLDELAERLGARVA